MYKSTSRSEQFYARSGSDATKGSRKGYSIIGGGECASKVLTEEEKEEAEKKALNRKREIAVEDLAKVKSMLGELKGYRPPIFYDLVSKREALKKEIAETMESIRIINVKIRERRPKPDGADVPPIFIDVAREMLTDAQFRMILKESFNRAAKRQEEKD